MWLNFIKPVADLAGGYLKNKAEEKQAKHKAKMKVIENDADWEARAVDASANSWKDEFWTIVLSVPIFMIGYSIVVGDPEIVERVEDGFVALSNLPEWYQYLLFIAISSSFGIKGVSKLMSLRK
jgi:hypothetical protein|tara:strand:- start:47 stop:418 length:372 start_codon:yes stop_codon:yes gene_type:complete